MPLYVVSSSKVTNYVSCRVCYWRYEKTMLSAKKSKSKSYVVNGSLQVPTLALPTVLVPRVTVFKRPVLISFYNSTIKWYQKTSSLTVFPHGRNMEFYFLSCVFCTSTGIKYFMATCGKQNCDSVCASFGLQCAGTGQSFPNSSALSIFDHESLGITCDTKNDTDYYIYTQRATKLYICFAAIQRSAMGR